MKIKQIHKNWKEVELKDIANFLSGFAFTSQDYSDKGLKIIRIQNLGNNKDEQFVYWNKEYDKKYLIKKGDLLLSLSGTVPVSFKIFKWDKENALLNQRIVKINLKDNKIGTKYLSYVIQGNLIKIYSKATSTTGIANVSLGTIKSLKIPLPFLLDGTPDLKEQERIVSILEKAEALKQKGKKAGDLLDEYLKSVFNEMFYNKGFEDKRFLEVFNTTTGKLDSNAMEDDGKYPFFTCSQETFKINNYAFDCEALLLAGNNAAGKYSVKYYKGKFNAYQRTYVLTLKEKDDFRYLHFVLTNKLEELRRISIGTNTKYLTLGLLKNIKIPLSPLSIQQKFAKIVEQVEKLKENVKKTKQNSEELFNSLMQKAFRGELVV